MSLLRILIGIALLSAGSANALPITTIFSGVASGTIGTTSFADAAFTITSHGDTTNRVTADPTTFWLASSDSTIFISGIGEIAIAPPLSLFFNPFAGAVGLNNPVGVDVVHVASTALYSWDMQSSIGPITGPGQITGLDYAPVGTALGPLLFVLDQRDFTFQAVVVPEPTSLVLLGMGLAGLRLLARSAAPGRRATETECVSSRAARSS